MDDELLLERARRGNSIALFALVERYLTPVVLVAEAVVRRGWLAEACAHAAFASLAQAWPRLLDREAFCRHLYQEALAAALATRHRPRAGGARLGRLPVAVGVAWALHVHAELGYRQIAGVLRVPAGRVRDLLAAARAAGLGR